MKVLITGATGRLGRTLSSSLTSAGHAVTGLSRRPRPSGDVEGRTADIATGDGLDTALDGADSVIHLASAPYRGSYTDAVEIEGTRRLLDTAERAGVRHVVYTSIVGADKIPWSYFRTKTEAEGEPQAPTDHPRPDSRPPRPRFPRGTSDHSNAPDRRDHLGRLPRREIRLSTGSRCPRWRPQQSTSSPWGGGVHAHASLRHHRRLR